MAEPVRASLYTIPAHRAFADALAAGLLRRFGEDRLALARGLILVPNNRSRRAITDAFVRASGGALLLPRIAAIGDPDDGDMAVPLDDAEAPLPPAVPPLARRMILARLVAEERAGAGQPIGAAEAVRLAGDLARTLDQLLVEEVAPGRLADLPLAEELERHWRRSLDVFRVVLDRWPAERDRLGAIDAATRRRLTLDRLAERWREAPPPGFVCAAGITDPAPAVARLLRCIALLPRGMAVFAGLDTGIDAREWDALGPHDPDPVTGRRAPSIETHPQFQIKLLLTRMGFARDEVSTWRGGAGQDAGLPRGRAIASALAPAAFTADWASLPADRRRLTGVRVAELPTPAAEAQAVALALRGALEEPGRTAALVTPDRGLARRVAAHAARWGIALDDSAGRLLSQTPPGTLLTAIADAATERFAPVPLLALLKHPLVRAGEGRTAWLDGARRLDRALRGPRPAPGLSGIDAHLADGDAREAAIRARAAAWWFEARALLAPLTCLAGDPQPLATLIVCLREAADALGGEAVWSGPAGRAAADLIAELEAQAGAGPALVDPAELPAILNELLGEVAVRPPQGGHPRLAIYGQIEARLQSADLMILGGLNEGVWPGITAPDPWLAPRIRTELGLSGLDRRIGVAAHDFAQALGAPAALVTRSRRDARQPAIASRFWRRLEALSGEGWAATRDGTLEGWAQAIDDPGRHDPAKRPAPSPALADRPRRIAVTDVDRLKADPYAFYAKRVLRLQALDAIDADPTAAWRGTAVHAVLEAWARDDDCVPERLRERAAALFDDATVHPLIRALWRPRLFEAIEWIAARIAAGQAEGRQVLAVERDGECTIAGITLNGKFDRIDRLVGGGLAIVDYKTGKPPSNAAVRAGYSLQLGLLGLLLADGGFAGVGGRAEGFEYWSMGRGKSGFGYVETPVGRPRDPITADEFLALAHEHFTEAAARWLTGGEPFTAKLHPEFAPYGDYDQLMRLDEWYGRERR